MARPDEPDRSALLEPLRQVVAQHPGLTARQLSAVLRGRKRPVAVEVVEGLLSSNERMFRQSGEPARWSMRVADAKAPGPGVSLAALAAAMNVPADVLLRAVRLWADSGDQAAAAIFTTLTTGGLATLTDAQTSELRRRVAAGSSPPTPPPPPPTPPTPPNPPTGSWTRGGHGVFALHVTTPRTSGERELFAALCRLRQALVVSGYVISGSGRRELETDALAVTPQGVFTVEQKDTRGSGVLAVPVNGPPTLNGMPLTKTANARAQARRQAQALAALFRESRLDLGFVVPVLCISGDVTLSTESSGEVLLATPATIGRRLQSVQREQHIVAAEAAKALERLQLPLLSVEELARIGFAAR